MRGASRSILLAGLCAALAALALHGAGALEPLEQDTRVLRFEQRGARPPADVVLVAIDGATGAALRSRWPYPRSRHARVVDELRRLGARTIVYDVQFTEETEPAEDLALFDAVRRAGNVVLATSETDGRGGHNVLGGAENVRAARADAAAANLGTGRDARVERFPRAAGGLDSIAVVAARAAGRPLPDAALDARGEAWIDFPGPPGSVPAIGFHDVHDRRVPATAVRGKVVVVGVTAATEQDLHLTSASRDRLMPGAEVQAAAVSTALRGLPLRRGPRWLDGLAVLLLALLPVAVAARRGAPAAAVAGIGGAAVWVGAAVAAFADDRIVAVAGPLAGAVLGTGAAVAAAWTAERLGRRRSEARSAVLDALVRERTAELHATQLELVERLALAAEWRDEDTGMHINRMSRMCERLALAAGWPAARAEQLRHASALHDIGKIAIPDRILLKRGRLDAEEWEVMRSHAEKGAEMLSGSRSPMVQLAEVVARTHHERWDGGGYPAGLAGPGIPLPGRIAAICDVFDALCSARPYKDAWPAEDALAEIERCAGTQFDPGLVALFVPLARSLGAAPAEALAVGA